MILYHGSNTEIDKIDLDKCRPYKDFGKGFYLTTIEEQAEKMAKRVARIYGGNPIVNKYEFDIEAVKASGLKIRTFDKPSKEWALFVINNRNQQFDSKSDEDNNRDNRYDIVIGPIANDDLALLFRQFSTGLIDVDTLVKNMEYKKLTDQYSFHSPEAVGYLKKV